MLSNRVTIEIELKVMSLFLQLLYQRYIYLLLGNTVKMRLATEDMSGTEIR